MIFLLLLSFAFAKAPAGCPAPQGLPTQNLNPTGISAWLKSVGTSVRTPEELVCCLPEPFKKQYMVGHSSLAGQNGIPVAPRVVLFDSHRPDGNAPPDRMLALSISGGGHSVLQQQNSVEFMYLNPATKELEYFDLEFEGRSNPKLSKNPTLCLNCHGLEGKTPPGGARPIFDAFGRWNRFVGGRSQFCSETEKNYFRLTESRAVDAIKKNPRYKCLDQSQLNETELPGGSTPFPSQFTNLAVLDRDLNLLNARRVLTLIKSYSSFKSLRPALVGLVSCGGSLSDWLPKDLVDRMLARTDHFEGSGAQASSLKELVERQRAEGRQLNTMMAKQLTDRSVPQTSPILIPRIGAGLCPDTLDANELSSGLTSSFKLNDPKELKSLDRFQNRNRLRGIQADTGAKLLFETLGEDTSFWEMSPTGEGALGAQLDAILRLANLDPFSDRQLKSQIERHFSVERNGGMIRPGTNDHKNLGAITSELDLFTRPGYDSCGEYKKSVQSNFPTPAAPLSSSAS